MIKKYTFNLQAGAEIETRIGIAESYDAARKACGINDAMAWHRLIDWKEESMDCGWCGENESVCKCAITCSDCEQELSKQEIENNNDMRSTEINKQPLCDSCVWNLKH